MANFGYIAVTPSDNAQPAMLLDLYVGAAGDVVVKSTYDTDPVTLKAPAAGRWMNLPHPVLFVMAATTATNLVGAIALSAR